MFKYQVSVDKQKYHNLAEMQTWCRESIGSGGYVAHQEWDHWHLETMFGNSTFSFKCEQDAVLFALRW